MLYAIHLVDYILFFAWCFFVFSLGHTVYLRHEITNIVMSCHVNFYLMFVYDIGQILINVQMPVDNVAPEQKRRRSLLSADGALHKSNS